MSKPTIDEILEGFEKRRLEISRLIKSGERPADVAFVMAEAERAEAKQQFTQLIEREQFSAVLAVVDGLRNGGLKEMADEMEKSYRTAAKERGIDL